jgi:gluconolactonase
VIRTVAEGLDHPECVAWDPRGFIFAGGEAGQLYRIDVSNGSHEIIADTRGWILGIALDEDGNAYLCDPTNHCVYKAMTNGYLVKLSDGTSKLKMSTPNFAVFDAQGNLYVSDSGYWESVCGRIYRISSAGETQLWSEAAPHFTNGLAIDPKGSYLYVAESTLPGITRIPILEDGSAGEPELVVDMPTTVPDGLAFDAAGTLYIGCYRPDRIYTYDSIQGLKIFADDYQGTAIGAPTNIAFGGKDLRTLFIASLARWHIGAIDVNVSGQPLHRPTEISNTWVGATSHE